MAAISATDVELVYADGTRAVTGVSLEIPSGEFFGFLGANGAGKTTMIKTLVTLLRPTSGSITVNGHDVLANPRAVRRSIGYMAQETSIDEELTARENIRFACDAYGVRSTDRTERIETLLDLVDLQAEADSLAKSFSGGMKKRLDVATALVHQPPVVFLDEPTTGLDPEARNRLWDYFRSINDDGTTVFLTTQYLEEADQLCDRISVIRDGSIVADGSPGALKSAVGGDVIDITLAEPTAEAIRQARAAVDAIDSADCSVEPTERGIAVTAPNAYELGPELITTLADSFEIEGFQTRSPTLDDVFLALTDDSNDHDRIAATDGRLDLEADR